MNENHDEHARGGSFPPDLAAVLAPTVLCLVALCLTCGISWAKAAGDQTLFNLALCLGVTGSALLFLARIPLYRQRRFFTLGPRSLTGVHRKLYYAAYWLLIPSIGLLGVLLWKLR